VSESRRLRVIMMVNEFAPLKVGGGERQAERLSIQYVKQGICVGVLTRKLNGLLDYEERDGFWIRRIPQFGWGKLKSLSFILGILYFLIRTHRNYDIVYAHLAFSPAIAAAIIGRLLGKPVIVLFGNSGEYGEVETAKATIRGRLKLSMLRKWVDLNIVLDRHMKTEVISAGFDPQKVELVANGIDTTEFYPSEDKEGLKKSLNLLGKTVVVFVGRLEPQKAVPLLLSAFSTAVASHPSMVLLVVGNGPDRSSLELLAKQLGIKDKVTFVGNVADVRNYLQAGDIFVLSSVSEGMPNALLEAMATGLACVVTNVGAADFMLGDGECGILIPPEEKDPLAEAMISLFLNPDGREKMGSKARKRAINHFDIRVIGGQYEEIFRSLLSKKEYMA